MGHSSLALRSGRLLSLASLACALAVLASGWTSATPALAAAPWWHLTTSVRPAELPPGGEGTIAVQASNVGDASTSAAVTLTDVLPAGMTVLEEGGTPEVGFFGFFDQRGLEDLASLCHVAGSRVTCTLPDEPSASPVPFPPQKPFENLEMRISVKAGAVSEEGEAEVSGGGAATVTVKQPVKIAEAAPAFGVENLALAPEEEGGALNAQAGSHPFQLTTTFALDQSANPLEPPALPRDLQFKLPPGLVGNPTSLPQCSELDFEKIVSFQDLCPGDTVVGVATVTFDEPKQKLRTWPFPIFNLVPAEGEPARFGFTVLKTPVILDTSVRTGSDYGVTVTVNNTSEVVNLLGTSVTLWGVPGEPSHNGARGWECLAGGIFPGYESRGEPCPAESQGSPAPFLTLPTSCSSPFSTTVEGDSWPRRATPASEPASVTLPPSESSLEDSFGRPLGITGCNQLPFDPSIEAVPDHGDASTPTGFKVDVRVPQETGENAGGLASSAIKDISVALPEGVSVNPASAGGLEACSEAQVGFTEAPGGTDLFTPGLPEPFCPTASKIGTVRIKVPVLTHPLEGALYLAAQNANPFGSLLAAYIVAEDHVSGVRVKLAGEVALNQETGQLVSTFENTPQAPLEEAEIHLFEGPRAPLATPARCGLYATNASFAPWSGAGSVSASSTFDISAGPNGSPCPDPLPFAPSLAAGAMNIDAGSFAPLTTTIAREDGNQNIQTVHLRYPPGVSGILTGIKLCSDAQANAGTCGAESLIGQSLASVGLGSEPYTVTGGQVFLTEGYKGAPFGLSIVTPAVAGPFNLGKVVVRAKVEVDPRSAALTVTTDAIPHILDGIPLEIKHVNVTIDRPGFTFNPTNCSPMSVTGAISSVEGASSPVSTPFQVANCAVLEFSPKIAVSIVGHASKANGASLRFRIAYPARAMGSQSWFDEAKFDIPKQLPARLETLQRACPSNVFEANRANCPKASVIGSAIVHTPVLPVPLTGPVYFVSYGGEKFPEAVLALQGYGVTVELHGETFINNKTGVTSATFRDTPDVPFESIEVSIPTGRFSEFGANLPAKDKYNFCGHKLSMPTLFKAQNGLEIHQSTPVGITGCKKAKKGKKATHGRKSVKRKANQKH